MWLVNFAIEQRPAGGITFSLEFVRTILECGNGPESRPLIAEYYLYLKSPAARGQ
ncbi:MAG: hypothetical protein VX988_03910 [Planctomycetota bacterium]|nr:hypothetical protein [Planctomycetota bacterium]